MFSAKNAPFTAFMISEKGIFQLNSVLDNSSDGMVRISLALPAFCEKENPVQME